MAGQNHGGGDALFSSREREEDDWQGWFCNFQKVEGANCKLRFPVDLGLK